MVKDRKAAVAIGINSSLRIRQAVQLRVVRLFVEGLRDGERVLRLIERATASGIRVVALKSGNSAKGLEAAASHTRKMASPEVAALPP